MTKNELLNIKGGATSSIIATCKPILIISAAIAFIAGVIEGFINPNKCNG